LGLLHEVDDVARLVAAMQRAGYSPWTINGALGTLSGCLRVAERRGLINTNPVRKLDKGERPKLAGAEKRILSEEEIVRLLETAGTSRTLHALISVGIFAGLRFGECLGLRWSDIDFGGGFIQVRRQLGRDRRLVDVKSDAGRRDVVLMPQLARVLRDHRMASLYKAEADLVFPAPGGQGRDHRSTGRAVERAVKRAGLGDGVSFHGFRHGFASMLIVELRLDPVNVARQLGHADPAITLKVYAHEFAKARNADDTRAGLEARFGRLLASS
jgi:integrase